MVWGAPAHSAVGGASASRERYGPGEAPSI